MCINFIAFIQEEKETVDNCTNVIIFLQEEKETVDICTNVISFWSRKTLYAFVLILLFFFGRRKRL